MDAAQLPKRRRRRTGCLSCRVRRIKCDERRPTCDRCEAANIECAGYERRRLLGDHQVAAKRHAIVRHTQDQTADASSSVAAGPSSADLRLCSPPVAHPLLSTNGRNRALVALPSNPDGTQRPCDGARWVLGYHQFLFRSIPILFEAQHTSFWLGTLCHRAWDTEYAFSALTALGSIHRAYVLMAKPGQGGQDPATDTKVIAVQTYVKALESLSAHLLPAQQCPEVLLATLALMACFECLAGNLRAAIGHISLVEHKVSTTMQSSHASTWLPKASLDALASCLRNFRRISYAALPFAYSAAFDDIVRGNNSVDGNINSSSCRQLDKPLTIGLRDDLDTIVSEAGMDSLFWTPISICHQDPAAADVYILLGRLHLWRRHHAKDLPNEVLYYSDEARLSSPQGSDEPAWRSLPMPPRRNTTVTGRISYIAAALHSFYVGRCLWTLCMLGESVESNEPAAYLHFYDALHFATSQLDHESENGSETLAERSQDSLRNEAVAPGFLPMLFAIGQCCPQPSWRRWIMQLLRRVNREGVFCGEAFAVSLGLLHTFETYHDLREPIRSNDFAPPNRRTLVAMIPAIDGRSYVCYYAAPKPLGPGINDSTAPYEFTGQARWARLSTHGHHAEPEIEFYSVTSAERRLVRHGMLHKPEIREWMRLLEHSEFDLDRALQNHMTSCSSLLPEYDSEQLCN